MLAFDYIAKSKQDSSTQKGTVDADSKESATKLLIKRNLIPIEVELSKEKSGFSALRNRVKTKDKILFTRQLSTLIGAGLPIAQSLRTVTEQSESPLLRSVISDITADIEAGSTLAKSFAKFPKVFNQVYVNLIAAGESSGTLDAALARIAIQQEKDAAVTSKIRGALIYPVIVLVVIFLVMAFLLTSVLPQIEALYNDLEQDLPFVTAVLVLIADFFVKYWWLVLLIIGGIIYALITYFHTISGRRAADTIKMKIPVFGRMFKKLYMARFARTAATLLKSGVPMLDMLAITSKAVNNVLVAESITDASAKVTAGKSLSSSLEGKYGFTKLVPQMVNIGEQSGALDEMLDKTAQFYEEELDNEIRNISTTIEPIMMVILAGMAAIVVGAILLPVYGLVGDSVAL